MNTNQKKFSGEFRCVNKLGKLLGEKIRDQITDADTSKERIRLAKAYPDWMRTGMKLAEEHTPLTHALLCGIADSVNLPYSEVFAGWYEELTYIDTVDKERLKDTGCTDLVIKQGELIIAHTNDEAIDSESELMKLGAAGFPEITAVFSGASPSVACNSAGLVFSGNQIDANDTRPGIPRSVLYMEACFSNTLDEARRILLNPHRASSFNNILADYNGNVVNIEASAKASAEVPLDDGALVHTNHFIWLSDREGRVGKPLTGSKKRLSRAEEEIEELGEDFDVEDVIKIMKTHGKGGLCRHNDIETDTCFSTLFLPERGIMIYGKGFPCSATYRAYRFSKKGRP